MFSLDTRRIAAEGVSDDAIVLSMFVAGMKFLAIPLPSKDM